MSTMDPWVAAIQNVPVFVRSLGGDGDAKTEGLLSAAADDDSIEVIDEVESGGSSFGGGSVVSSEGEVIEVIDEGPSRRGSTSRGRGPAAVAKSPSRSITNVVDSDGDEIQVVDDADDVMSSGGSGAGGSAISGSGAQSGDEGGEIIDLDDDGQSFAGASGGDSDVEIISEEGEQLSGSDDNVSDGSLIDDLSQEATRQSLAGPSPAAVETIKSIKSLVSVIDDRLHAIFQRIPPCRTYLHWRNLLKAVVSSLKGNESKLSASIPLPRLEQVQLAISDAKERWFDVWHSIPRRGGAGGGDLGDTKSDSGQAGPVGPSAELPTDYTYLQISLDEDTHPLKRDLANLELAVYRGLAAITRRRTDSQVDIHEDDDAVLFWWRFFGVKSQNVSLSRMCSAMSLFLRHEYDGFVGDESVLRQLLNHTLDTGLKQGRDQDSDGVVSEEEFREFISRYGPLKSCFKNMIGVCVWSRREGKIQPAEWFYPKGRGETEARLLYHSNRQWVARLGWRIKHMAFVISRVWDKKHGDVRHTPVTHKYKAESDSHMYEMEGQRTNKWRGQTMRELIRNGFSGSDVTAFYPFPDRVAPGEINRAKKLLAEEAAQWETLLGRLRKRQTNLEVKSVALEEVFELNKFFKETEKEKKAGAMWFGGGSGGSGDSGLNLNESILDITEGHSLLENMRKMTRSIYEDIQGLVQESRRKTVVDRLRGLMSQAANTMHANEKVAEQAGRILWAFNDYRGRDGKTVMHELVNAATTLLSADSKRRSASARDEKQTAAAIRSIMDLIRSLSSIGVPMHVKDSKGKTPVESVVAWFVKQRGAKGVLSNHSVRLFHNLFIVTYQEATKAGALLGSEDAYRMILVEAFKGFLPQGDIEIVEFFFRSDRLVKYMLKNETNDARNVFVSLLPTSARAIGDMKSARPGSLYGYDVAAYSSTVTTAYLSFLHFLIEETNRKKGADSHFDSYNNAPRIARLMFEQMRGDPRRRAMYLSVRAGPYTETPILAAARTGHRPMLHFLLHAGTTLHRELRRAGEEERDDVGSLSTAVSNPSICEMADRNGDCLLHHLAKGEDCNLREISTIVAMLESVGEPTPLIVEKLNSENKTPLAVLLDRLSAPECKKDSVEYLEISNVILYVLAKGARVTNMGRYADLLAEVCGEAMLRCVNYRWTILRNAVRNGDAELTKILLNRKGSLFASNPPFLKHPRLHTRKHNMQETFKRRAARGQFNAAASAAVSYDASTRRGVSPKVRAWGDTKFDAKSSGAQMASYQASGTATAPWGSISDHTILHVATSSPHSSFEIVKLLFEQDQSISDRMVRAGRSDLLVTPQDVVNMLQNDTHAGPSRMRQRQRAEMQSQLEGDNLVRLGLNLTDEFEKNPLHYIASKQNTETRDIAKLLIEKSIDIVHMDGFGMTPLHVAAQSNQLEIVNLLVNTHMHLDIKTAPPQRAMSPFSSPPSPAHVGGGFKVALLPSSGGRDDFNSAIEARHDRTPLFFAVEQGNWQICSLLLAKKAQVDALDSQGKTSLTVALMRRHGSSKHLKLLEGATQMLETWVMSLMLKNWDELTPVEETRHIETWLLECETFFKNKRKIERQYHVVNPDAETSAVVRSVQRKLRDYRNDNNTMSLDQKHKTSSHAAAKHSLEASLRVAMQAIDAEKSRMRPWLQRYKMTIEVLLNHGAGIDAAFQFTTMDIKLCIDVDEEFETLEKEVKMIEWEAYQAYERDKEAIMREQMAEDAFRQNADKLRRLGGGGDVKRAFSSSERPQVEQHKRPRDQLPVSKSAGDAKQRRNRRDQGRGGDGGGGDSDVWARSDDKPRGAPVSDAGGLQSIKYGDGLGSLYQDGGLQTVKNMQSVKRKKSTGESPGGEAGAHGGGGNGGVSKWATNTVKKGYSFLKRRSEDQSYFDAYNFAILKRKDALFQDKYKQIVIGEKYKRDIKNTHWGELIRFILFLILMTYVGIYTSARDNKAAYLFWSGAKQTLIDDEFPSSISSLRRTFDEIDNVDEFYMWAKGPFLDVLYPSEQMTGYVGSTQFMQSAVFLGQGTVVGTPRWRQQRSSVGNCDLYSKYSSLGDKCFSMARKSWLPDGATGDKGAWGPSSEYAYGESPGAFSLMWARGSGSYYSGGGFSIDFPTVGNFTVVNGTSASRNQASQLLSTLQDGKWIDAVTRAVFVEFNVYNANNDLWMMGKCIVELPNTGGVKPSFEFTVLTEMGVGFSPQSTGLFYAKLLAGVLVLINMSLDVIDMFLSGAEYLKYMYNYVSILINVLYVLIGIVQLLLFIKTSATDFSVTDEFVDLTEIAFLGELFTNVFSLILFLLWVKLTDMLSVSKAISTLVVMITIMMSELKTLIFFMSIMWFAFGSGIFVAYGYRNEGNAIWLTSLITSISNSFQGQDLIDDRDKAPFMGTIYGALSLLFTILVLMNLVIAILTTAYERAREEVGAGFWAKHQYRLIQQKRVANAGRNCCARTKANSNAINEYLYRSYIFLLLLLSYMWNRMCCCASKTDTSNERSENDKKEALGMRRGGILESKADSMGVDDELSTSGPPDKYDIGQSIDEESAPRLEPRDGPLGANKSLRRSLTQAKLDTNGGAKLRRPIGRRGLARSGSIAGMV